MNRKEKILVIDDEVENLSLLRVRLESSDFDVITSDNPHRGILLASSQNPDLILLDLNMPEMNGFQVCKKLKEKWDTSHIPILMLTCMDDIDIKLKGLDMGADDYIVKDKLDYRELAARIRSHLRRMHSNMSANPLTRLPGNISINNKVSDLIRSKRDFVIGYVDIDNFKAYNDYYSFQQGDKIIQFVAQSLVKIVEKYGNPDDFVGHIGGDDFIFISDNEHADIIADSMVKWIESVTKQLYHEEDQINGGIVAKDRDGKPKLFGFIGVTIALVSSKHNLPSFEEYSTIASKIKKKLKNQGGKQFGSS